MIALTTQDHYRVVFSPDRESADLWFTGDVIRTGYKVIHLSADSSSRLAAIADHAARTLTLTPTGLRGGQADDFLRALHATALATIGKIHPAAAFATAFISVLSQSLQTADYSSALQESFRQMGQAIVGTIHEEFAKKTLEEVQEQSIHATINFLQYIQAQDLAYLETARTASERAYAKILALPANEQPKFHKHFAAIQLLRISIHEARANLVNQKDLLICESIGVEAQAVLQRMKDHERAVCSSKWEEQRRWEAERARNIKAGSLALYAHVDVGEEWDQRAKAIAQHENIWAPIIQKTRETIAHYNIKP